MFYYESILILLSLSLVCLFACLAAGMVRGMYLDLIDRRSLSSVFLLPVTIINGVLAKIEKNCIACARVTCLEI